MLLKWRDPFRICLPPLNWGCRRRDRTSPLDTPTPRYISSRTRNVSAFLDHMGICVWKFGKCRCTPFVFIRIVCDFFFFFLLIPYTPLIKCLGYPPLFGRKNIFSIHIFLTNKNISIVILVFKCNRVTVINRTTL